jgi:predicted hotdog family 3-hydroxylacyl-ACP dehydratase/3-hydroxymyristoyl/3-hydroxydecanoyl-(acyl carrier protein) dehydratase
LDRVAPQLSGIRREASQEDGTTLFAVGRVPRDLSFFAGHFPDHPVLPGFVQLHWVAELARDHLGIDGPWTGIDALKFRTPLLPDDRFDLEIRAGAELRFALRRDDEVLSEGRLRRGAPPAAPGPSPRATSGKAAPAAPDPGLVLRIPQQGAMRLLTRVRRHADGVTTCDAQVGEEHPLAASGRVPVWIALELLAQGMAAQGGLELGDALERRAFVVGARRLVLSCRELSVGEPLWVRARHVRGESGLVVCDCDLGRGTPPDGPEPAGGRTLASGRLTAFVEPASATSTVPGRKHP